MDPIASFNDYEQAALEAIRVANSPEELEAARVEFLGKKKGRLRDLQSMLGKVEPKQRPVFGKRFNEVKSKVEQALKARQSELSKPRETLTGLDVTLPGTPCELGRRHPITQTIEEFKDIMGRFGFTVAEGPEITSAQAKALMPQCQLITKHITNPTSRVSNRRMVPALYAGYRSIFLVRRTFATNLKSGTSRFLRGMGSKLWHD